MKKICPTALNTRGRTPTKLDFITGSGGLAATAARAARPCPRFHKEKKKNWRAARATIPPAFSYIASRLGVESAETLQLGSPFDYTRQATLYIEANLPEPSDANR